MNPPQAVAKNNSTAIFAVISSVLGFFCFFGLGGVLGIVLGVTSRGEIERSGGRERGRGLATLAIALGVLNIATAVVGAGVAVALLVRPDAPQPSLARGPGLPAPALTVLPPGAGSSLRAAPLPDAVTVDRGVRVTELGRVRLVDLSPGGDSFRSALERQIATAKGNGERFLVFVVAPDCTPCNGVLLSLREERMQSALGGLRLLRVSVTDYAPELVEMGIPTETVPGFALLSQALRVADYVHGGEWDADIANNIAPVLGSFLQGRYIKRRHPFVSPPRPDQTAL